MVVAIKPKGKALDIREKVYSWALLSRNFYRPDALPTAPKN